MIYILLAIIIWIGICIISVDLDDISFGRYYLIFEWDGYKYLQVFNWLDKDYRYWGYHEEWCHGPWVSFGLYFFNVAWCFR